MACGIASGQTLDKNSLSGMSYRFVGPFRGGRVEAVLGMPGNPYVFYFGAAAGGVWKTTDGGLNWTPMFDHEPVASIGAIAVAPSDPNIIYVGTGEPCFRGDITYGDGMYKSVDGGKTWTHIGLDDTRHISHVLIDPHDPNIVFVAAEGHAFGPTAERGVFRTTDGGKTWQKVLYKDDKTGAVDLTFDGNNSHVLFAALYQVVRKPWDIVSGGPGSGIYKSSDGGTTWKHLEGHGLPDGILGRIGISISAAQPDRVYALIEAEKGGVYVSNDAGESWQLVTGDHRFLQRAFYYTHIFSDPSHADTIYILNVGAYKSTDAGKTWITLRPPHGDNHALWIDPENSDRMITGDDGGAAISNDGGNTWTPEDNQPTAQFYHVAADNQFHYYLYGAQQDNSTVAIASSTDHGVIGRQDWYPVGGGESGYIVSDPDGGTVYAGGNYGIITRWTRETDQEHLITPAPVIMDGSAAADQKYRFQWTAPIVVSPFDEHTLYIGAQVLFKTTDGGQSWAIISPDLTRNDKSKQQLPGGPITKDSTSVEFYDTIFTVAESPVEKGLIWTGSDDGLVHITRDGGKNWEDVTPKQMPEWSKISLIEASPFDAGTAYIAVDRHMLDDLNPYIYKTSDFGKTWSEIINGIPNGSFVHAVREDTKRKGLLFAGTETRVMVSFDDGEHWQSLQLNLPTVPVHDLIIKNDDLAIATHGRAFWILDDITPLRELRPDSLDQSVHLFEPAPAYHTHSGGGFFRARGSVGSNPPGGVIIDYALKSPSKGDVTLEIVDSSGHTVRKYSSNKQTQAAPSEFPRGRTAESLPNKAGLNRIVWNMRYESPREVPGAVYDNGPPEGVLALPGKYQVKLTVDGQSYTAPIQITPDPRVKTSMADMQKQFNLATQVRNLEEGDHDTVLAIRDLRSQLQALEKRLGQSTEEKDVVAEAQVIEKKMSAIEEQLIEPKAIANEDQLNYGNMLSSQLAYLENSVDASDEPPTQPEYEQYATYQEQVGKLVSDWKAILNKDVLELNNLMRRSKTPPIGVTAESARTD
ncbi:MAG: hypothetical protein WBD23_12375 [Candidatus Acidiferrales bacterium]